MEGNGRTQEPGQQSDSQPLVDSSNKAPGNKGQIENARLRRKQLEKRREELYGGTSLHMDVDEKVDAVETRDDPVFAEWASRDPKERMRVENKETQAEALREMRMIRKKENQTVVQFCLELELLSSKAYPSCDAAALALIRAEVLHQQLRDWPETYHLSKILANEDMRSVYERMKDAALRIEHLRRQRAGFNGRRFSSATLRGWACKVATADTQVSSLIGPKHMVRLQCLGLELPAMIDTGSQLTIMPLSFLLKAREAGGDMDTLCKEVKAEQLEVFDVSGNQMDFLGCMETKMELVGGNRGIIQMHIKRLRDEVVLLRINALEVLGVKITISSTNQAQTQAKQKSARDERSGNLFKERRETPQATSMAVIAKRSYVKPRNCGTIQVRSGHKPGDAVLWSHDDRIQSGVCAISKEGVAEVPVLNNSEEPVIFKEGEIIGEWSQHDWVDPRLIDSKSDMLEISKSNTTESKLETLSYPKQLIMMDDVTHPLHVLFACSDKARAKPPGDFNGFRLTVPCPLPAGQDATRLDHVLKDLPAHMKGIRFENVCRMAQLIDIWLEESLSEREKLVQMAKNANEFSAEALAVALLHYRGNCLHFQLSEEKLRPPDFYHDISASAHRAKG
ncbi:hypothetical protein GCK32_013968 [Trichostrongylus colubriformis]|uniref:Peptidase A2 domain-containing protein n=1 Tax=Trichostrongylus colubriformis TaxID=6319 RepID=A0AAN8IJQ4_TRICO